MNLVATSGGTPAAARPQAAPAASLADLMAAAARERCAQPHLLCLLVLTRLLEAIAAERAAGRPLGSVTAERCRLTGPPPARLLRDCPRDPRRIDLATARRDEATATDALAAAGVLARQLRAAAGGRPDGALAGLLDALDTSAAGTGDAEGGAERAWRASRALTLRELAAWERGRPPLRDGVDGGGPATDVAQPAPRGGEGPGARELSGGAARSATAAAVATTPAPAATAVSRPQPAWPRSEGLQGFGGRRGHGVIAWATLGPAAVATLLTLLLTTMLLLG